MKKLIVLLSSILITGCSSLLGPAPVLQTAYVINTIPAVSAKSSADAVTLQVAPVDAVGVYNTAEMAYSDQQYQIAYFAKSRWADAPAQMLHPLILQTLQNSHHFHAVTSTSVPSQADYILNTQLLEMRQQFYACRSVYRIKLRAQIVGTANSRVVATKVITVEVSAPYNNAYGGVIAANQAAAAVLKKLTYFCVTNL